jgi:hypothetical protein
MVRSKLRRASVCGPKQVSVPSLAPWDSRIRVKSDRAVHDFGRRGKVLGQKRHRTTDGGQYVG